MTTCAECLTTLSTTRLADIPRDSVVAAHVATCPNCSRLVADMQYADQRLALALDSSIPRMPPTTLAANTMAKVELEHRKSVALWFRRGLAFAAGLLAVAFFRTDTGKYLIGTDDFQQQTIQLRCISSADALEIATPYLRSNKGRIYRAGDLQRVTVQGKAAEVNAALSQIERAERETTRCAVPAPVAAPGLNPGVGTLGKD